MRLKGLLIFGFFLLGVFMFGQKALAGYSYSNDIGKFMQEAPGVNDITFLNFSTNATSSVSSGFGRVLFSATSTASSTLGVFTSISAVSILMSQESGSPITVNTAITCVDGTGTHNDSSTGTIVPSVSQAAVYSMVFSSPVTCNSATLISLVIDLNQNGQTAINFYGAYIPQLDPGWPGDGIGIAQNSSGFPFNPDYHVVIGINDNLDYLAGAQGPVGVAACDSTDFIIFNVDFGKGFCKVMRFLFYPSQSSKDSFAGLWNNSLSKKPPFGYFTAYEAELASTTPSSTPSTVFASMGILASSSSIFGVFDIGIASVFSFLFGWWVFNRLRHWDFHL